MKKKKVVLKVEQGMIVLYIDGRADTNFGFGVSLKQIKERIKEAGAS